MTDTIDKPIADIDTFGPEYAANWKAMMADLRVNKPVAWSNQYGGFWMLTKYDDIVFAERNWEIFSADNDINNERNGAHGIRIPRNPWRITLNESDPPFHTALRAVEMPHFNVQAMQRWFAYSREIATEHLNAFIAKGSGNLVEEYTIPVPAKVTLRLVGIPDNEWQDYMDASLNSYLPTTDPDHPIEQRLRITQRIEQLMDERRAEPRDDMISILVHATVEGEPLAQADARGMLQALCFGGFDTTAATAANAIRWLEDKPEIRARLAIDDTYLSHAVDEFLRYFPPLTGGLARTVVQDHEMRGVQLRKGDRVLLMFHSGNFDEERFPDPDTCDLERRNSKQHLAFGAGPHRCLGNVLGHAEVGTLIQEWCRRIRDYKIDREHEVKFRTAGLQNGWHSIPVSFTAA